MRPPLLLLALACCAIAVPLAKHHEEPQPSALREATVDLSLAPELRWDAVIRRTVDEQGWNNTFGLLVKYMDNFIKPSMQPAVDFVLKELDPLLGEYGAELKGIAATMKALGHGEEFPLGKLVAINLVYEVSAACTSIVAAAANGSVYHGRNLDWGRTTGFHNIAWKINYVKDGKPAYSALHLLGYIGVLTGVRAGGLSVSLDQRTTHNGSMWQNLEEALFKRGKLATLELRSALSSGMSFDEAVDHLAAVHLIAPSYLIVGGTNGNGAVITRDRDHAADVWRMGANATDDKAWFLVETNYDHWKPAPKHDDRRDPAIASLNALGQAALNVDTMTQVMTKAPVLNSGTVYSSVMNVDTGAIDAQLWL